ncbi:MAG: type II toxin-antitoxin system Phd/YefM family antitoxin [Methylocella sp.]
MRAEKPAQVAGFISEWWPASNRYGGRIESEIAAKAHLSQLLDDVERGETVVITRHGRPIARIVPEAHLRQEEIDEAIEGIKAPGAGAHPKRSGASPKPVVVRGAQYAHHQ